MSTLSSVFAAALTIGTYNVRFDVDKGDRTWAKRQPRVAQVVRRGGFDVVGFQEVRTDMWAGFTNALPEYAWTDGTRLTNPIAGDGRTCRAGQHVQRLQGRGELLH